MLISMLSATLVVNKLSLEEKTTELKAKSNIDRTFHLLEVSTNNALNMYMYRGDAKAQQIAISELEWDTLSFEYELNRQFIHIDEERTPLNNEVLYDYLKTPTNWTFAKAGVFKCELLQFFKINFYLFWDVRNYVVANPGGIGMKRDSLVSISSNTVQLRFIRDYLISITEDILVKNDRFNTIYLIGSLVVFLLFSGAFALYVNNYKKFRFNQN